MRVLLGCVLMVVPLARLFACDCARPGTPCFAAGRSVAVFIGTVLDVASPVRDSLRATGSMPTGSVPFLRVARMQVGAVLSGIPPGQKQIEIGTGQGGADCGYAFKVGTEYVVYAYRNADGRLETGICSRTRPVAEAAEDLEYFRAMAHAPETGRLSVLATAGGARSKPGVPITVERIGSRYRALTNGAGEVIFPSLPPGRYTIHAEPDGNLPDDPSVEVYAKGCLDVTFFRTPRIIGRLMTKTDAPAVGIEVQVRSAGGGRVESAWTGADGRYELRTFESGPHTLGINLNHTPTVNVPYPQWFHPGTSDPASATKITFSGEREVQTYDLTLPERLPERSIDGIVLGADGQPRPMVFVRILDDSRTEVDQTFADRTGRFALRVFAGRAYRLHATWRGVPADQTVSAEPVDIEPGTDPLSLRLTLNRPGMSSANERR